MRAAGCEIPAALLSCPPAPEPPPSGAGQRAAAVYLLRLAAAEDACRSRLAAVRRLVERAE